MAITYEPARPEIKAMADEVMRKYHPELEMGNSGEYPRLCIMTASSDDPEDPSPLKLHGYPCAAIISIIPYKQRVDKRADAEILIDARNWHDLTEPQQIAILDHECEHLQIQYDEHGIVKTDDCGRPKLKMRLHDFTVAGFRSIAIRHGDNAPEVLLAQDFVKKFGADVLPKTELFEKASR